MILEKLEIYPYEIKNRKGILIRLRDKEGNIGLGEASPLPGRSVESFDEALSHLHLIQKDLSLCNPRFFAPPSVLFGMESALAMLSGIDFPEKYLVTRLIEQPERCDFSKEEPFTYPLKIKLGHLSPVKAVSLTKQFLALSATPAIDLNRKWSLEETLFFCSHFHPDELAYIEDPVSLFTHLNRFYERSLFPYAVDEFLLSHPLERILSLKGLTHLILKPTLLGGFHPCKVIVETAAHLSCIFSSSYETTIGLKHIARIGMALNPIAPLGIDTPSPISVEELCITP